jgi:hypothetical protein
MDHIGMTGKFIALPHVVRISEMPIFISSSSTGWKFSSSKLGDGAMYTQISRGVGNIIRIFKLEKTMEISRFLLQPNRLRNLPSIG